MTQAILQNLMRPCFFFSNVFFLLTRDPFLYIFFSWLLTHYLNTRRMLYFLNKRFEVFNIYILYSQDKNYFFKVGFEVI